MTRLRPSLRHELLLALLALALIALNFGHASAVFAAEGRVVITAHSVCGDPLAPSAGEHFACHACRPNVAALPPAPVAVLPVAFTVVSVLYAAPLTRAAVPRHALAASPRGPPELV